MVYILSIEWAADNRNTEIIRLLVSQLELPEAETPDTIPETVKNFLDGMNADQIVTVFAKNFQKQVEQLLKMRHITI